MGALDDITWKSLFDDLWLRARREAIPISGTFELTPLCNFRCRMCYVRLDPEEMKRRGTLYPANAWLKMAREAVDMGLVRVSLTGGEILTRPDFAEIYSGLCEMGLLVSLMSNGYLLTKELTELLKEYPPSNVRFTLYGTSNETYERLCGVKNGFSRVMKSVDMLRQSGVPVSFAFTQTKVNYSDLNEAIEIARKLDTSIEIASDLTPAVRGAHSEAECLRVSSDTRKAVRDLTEAERRHIEDDVANTPEAKELLTGAFGTCRHYRTFFFVDWNGDMESCALMSHCHSRPFEVGFKEAWNDMLSKLELIRVPQKCLSCIAYPLCTACPGRREVETGNVEGVPSRSCEDAFDRLSLINNADPHKEVTQA